MMTISDAYNMYMEIEKLREHNVGVDAFCNLCEASSAFIIYKSLLFTYYKDTTETRTDCLTGEVLMDCDKMDAILDNLISEYGHKILM